MLPTGIFYNEVMLDHFNPNETHPECPERIIGIFERLEAELPRSEIQWYRDTLQITPIQLQSVHDTDHVKAIMALPDKPMEELETLAKEFDSIYLNENSTKSALCACEGVYTLAKELMNGVIRNGFAIVRPPGHHAEKDCPMGFCLINNVGVTAKLLLDEKLAERIMIVDWDIHHGNGTQRMFYDDPSVLYVSIHRYEDGAFYPQSKDADPCMVGKDTGLGRNINIAWDCPGSHDGDYIYAFTRIVLPVAYEFNPDLVIVSAGFDAAMGDPIGQCFVSPEGFGHLTHMLKGIANGKLLLALEGGYNVDAISASALSCVQSLIGLPLPRLSCNYPRDVAVQDVELTVLYHSMYWQSLRPLFKNTSFKNVGKNTLFDNIPLIWSKVLSEMQMIPFPFTDQIFEDMFKLGVHMTSDILNNSMVVLLLHEWPLVVYEETLTCNVLNAEDISLIFPFQKYISSFIKKGYSCLDIHLSGNSDKWFSQMFFKLLDHLWENCIQILNDSQVIVICSSSYSHLITKYIDSRAVEDKVELLVNFAASFSPPPVSKEKSEWFYDHSYVIVPHSNMKNEPLGWMKPYGNCVSSGNESQDDMPQVVANFLPVILEKIDNTIKK